MGNKNAKGAGSIRKRSEGFWEARYTIGRNPGTGKQIQKSVYGKTQAEVRKKLQAICFSIDEGVYTEPSKYTLSKWFEIWLKEYTSNLKPYTIKSYESYIRNRITPAIGAIKLSTLTTSVIQSFYNSLKNSTELSSKTIKNIHGILHKALEQAIKIGAIKNNPSDACQIPRVEKPEIRALEDSDIAVFLKAIQGHKYETLYLVDLFTGLRQGEILGLTWDCIDFENGSITIYRQLQKIDGKYKFISLKNDKKRYLTPASAVMKILSDYKRVQNEWRLKAGTVWENNSFVFTNETGRNLSHNTVYKNFKRIVKQIGLPEITFHGLRHSYALAALQSGDDIKTVQETLGHYSAAFTLDIYGHVSESMRRDSAKRMDNFIRGVTEK